MRVAILAHRYFEPSGVGVYTRELLRHLDRLGPPGAYLVLYPGTREIGTLAAELPRSAVHALPDGRWLLPAWHFLGMPRVERLAPDFDVLHVPVPSVRVPTRKAMVVTLHDLAPQALPWSYSWRARWFLDGVLAELRSGATQIVANSEATRRHVLRALAIPADRVTTTRLGVDPARFRPIMDPARIEAVRARYGLPRRFLLFVGAISPRKNLPLLLAAHARLAGRRPSPDIVLVGPATRWGDGGARQHAGVRVVGFVEPDDLPAVYSAAELLVYPSLHEGFGLPIVEAMACGLPVVCTRAADPDELAADAAVYVSGHDAGELAQAIEHLDDGPRRERAIAAGLEQARHLSWQRCAEETRSVYQAAFRAHARTIQDG